MADSSSSPDSPDPFSSAAGFDEGAGGDDAHDAPPWEKQTEPTLEGASLEDLSPAFALSAARIWVQQHQKASMLGAFAVGVFVGAILRE